MLYFEILKLYVFRIEVILLYKFLKRKKSQFQATLHIKKNYYI